jgi:5'-methylthioadenosine phosphorylase
MMGNDDMRRKGAIGIIGGTGVDAFDGFEGIRASRPAPFGVGDARYSKVDSIIGEVNGRKIVYVARHGFEHNVPPHNVNFLAQMALMKMEGCEAVLGISAVGSLDKRIEVGDIVIPDEWMQTPGLNREHTFYNAPFVVHTAFPTEVCPSLSEAVAKAAEESGYKVHRGGTYATIQGPEFYSAKKMHRLKEREPEAMVIGMCMWPEASLAKQVEICYTMVAIPTDTLEDADKGDLSAEFVIENAAKNNANYAPDIVSKVLSLYDSREACGCGSSLKGMVHNHPPWREIENTFQGKCIEKYVKDKLCD